MYLVYNTIALEELNKPTVLVCNQSLEVTARSHAAIRGMPSLRVVPTTVPCDVGEAVDEIEAGIAAAMDNIVAALTQSLSEEERAPKTKHAVKPSRIVFKGDLEEVNRFFYKSGWADGSPVIPPTEETVQEMLTGTDLPPDHIVGHIGPRGGKATVEKIAINAVMAGALPSYMPVLIAGVQALLDPNLKASSLEVSMGSWGRFWIINGRIRNDINVNGGTEALSIRDKPNATIGRTLGLIAMNIGGARPGIEARGTFGNPGKYSMVIAENEEESPWEPLHVEQGLNKDDSAISVFFFNNALHVEAYSRDDKGMLKALIYNFPPGTMGYSGVFLTPPQARRLADKNWTKQDIAGFISEYARVPAYKHPWSPSQGSTTLPLHLMPVDPMNSMAISRREWIRVIVAGGPTEHFMGLFWGTHQYGGWITKKVDLPRNWDTMVKKYKDIVPKYSRY